MALIPQNRSRQPAPRGRSQALRSFDSPIAEGIQAVGREVGRAERHRDQSAVIAATATLRSQFATRYADAASKAAADGTGFQAGLQSQLDQYTAGIAETLPSDDARELWAAQVQRFGAELEGRANAFEIGRAGDHRAQQLGRAIDTTANTIRSDPTQYEAAREEILAQLDFADGDLPADAMAVLREAAEQELARSALRGGIDEDPEAALAALNSGDFDGRLTPDQKNTLINQATAERDRLARAAERAAAVERGAYLDDAGDYVAFLRAGNLEANDRFSVENQVAVLGEEKAAALQEEISRAWVYGGDANIIQTGSPEEAAEVLTARAAGLESVDDFTVQSQDFDRLRRLWTDTVEARAEDPGLQALQSPEVADAYEALLAARGGGDAEAIATAAGRYRSINAAEQERQGVPEHLRRVLPNRDLEAWGRVLEGSTPDEATLALGQFHRNHGQAGLDQIAETLSIDRPALGMAAFYAQRDPRLTSDLLDGARLLRENTDLRPSRDEIEGPLQDLYGGLFEFTPEIRDDYREAAVALYARGAVAGDGSFDEAAFETALQRVGGARASARGALAGGPFVFQNRITLPIAPGEGEDTFRQALFAIDNAALDAYGNGRPVGTLGDRVGAGDIRMQAQAVSVGFGRYMFLFEGGGFVGVEGATDGNSVFVFDMARYREEQGHTFRPIGQHMEGVTPEMERIIRERLESDRIPDLTGPPIAAVPPGTDR